MLFWVFLTCKMNASMNMFDKIKNKKNKKYTAWTFIASTAARLCSWFHILCCSTTCWASPAWCIRTTEKTSTTKRKDLDPNSLKELENLSSKSDSYCDNRAFTGNNCCFLPVWFENGGAQLEKGDVTIFEPCDIYSHLCCQNTVNQIWSDHSYSHDWSRLEV